MKMLGHDDIRHNNKVVSLADLFENLEKQVSTAWRAKKSQTPIAPFSIIVVE